MKHRSYAVTALPLLSYAAAMHTALMLLAFRDAPIPDHRGMLLWWAALLVCHGVLGVFLRKSRELRSVVLVCAALLCVQLAVTIRLNPVYPSLTWWAAAVCMWAAGYYQCASAYMEGVKPEALMMNFETTALTLLAAAAISGSEAMDRGVVVHLAVGLLCALIAMMSLRTLHTRVDAEGERPITGLLMPLILLGAAGCAIVFCVLISGGAERALTVFTAWLGRVLKAAVNALGAFVFWLFSLLPEPEGGIDNGDAFADTPLPSGTLEGMPEQSGVMLYLLIAAVIIGLLVALVKIWRTVRTNGRGPARRYARAVSVDKRGFGDGLRRFFARILRRVRFEVRYLRSYNTAAGLLVWLEWKMRTKGMKRYRGETTASFLRRVGERYPNCAESAAALTAVLDRFYFGGGDDMTAAAVREMRKCIRHGMKEE